VTSSVTPTETPTATPSLRPGASPSVTPTETPGPTDSHSPQPLAGIGAVILPPPPPSSSSTGPIIGAAIGGGLLVVGLFALAVRLNILSAELNGSSSLSKLAKLAPQRITSWKKHKTMQFETVHPGMPTTFNPSHLSLRVEQMKKSSTGAKPQITPV
jgi:hypothetical protein